MHTCNRDKKQILNHLEVKCTQELQNLNNQKQLDLQEINLFENQKNENSNDLF